MDPLVIGAAEAIIRSLLVASGKALAGKAFEGIFKSKEGRKTLENYLDEQLRDVSKLVSYRPTEQHIDDAYVEPRILDGALSRAFLKPAISISIKNAMLAGDDELALQLFSSRFHRSFDHSLLRLLLSDLKESNAADLNTAYLLEEDAEQIVEIDDLSIGNLLEQEGVLILGDAGSGKSALLARICFLRLKQEHNRIPIFLTSHELRSASPVSLVQDIIGKLQLGQASTESLEPVLAFYLDGLDELVRDRYHETCRDIAILRKRFPGSPLIAACRSAAYGGELSFLREVTIAPFDERRSEEFVFRWFKPVKGGPAAADFIAAVRHDDRLNELVTQPLLLSLMCNAFRRYLRFSRRHSTLFTQCVDALMWEWDSMRGISRPSAFGDLDIEKRVWLHARLAFELHSNRTRFTERRDLLLMLEQLIPAYGIQANQASKLLGEICSHYGLMVKWTEETFGFGHLALQEFLAGKWLSQERRWIGYITEEVIRDPWWRNVIGLAIGCLSDGTEAITRIMAVKALSESERYKMATHCLRYDPIVDPVVRGGIVRQMLSWYHNGDIDQYDAAVMMMVGIEDEYTARILRSSLQSSLPTRNDAEKAARRVLSRSRLSRREEVE